MARAIASGLLVALLLAGQALAADSDVTLAGVIRTADGKPVSGVKVVVTCYNQMRSALTENYFPEEFTATSDFAGRFVVSLPADSNSPRVTVEIPAASRLHLVSYAVTPDLFDIFARLPLGSQPLPPDSTWAAFSAIVTRLSHSIASPR